MFTWYIYMHMHMIHMHIIITSCYHLKLSFYNLNEKEGGALYWRVVEESKFKFIAANLTFIRCQSLIASMVTSSICQITKLQTN